MHWCHEFRSHKVLEDLIGHLSRRVTHTRRTSEKPHSSEGVFSISDLVLEDVVPFFGDN